MSGASSKRHIARFKELLLPSCATSTVILSVDISATLVLFLFKILCDVVQFIMQSSVYTLLKVMSKYILTHKYDSLQG